jgi:hypothetical protein
MSFSRIRWRNLTVSVLVGLLSTLAMERRAMAVGDATQKLNSIDSIEKAIANAGIEVTLERVYHQTDAWTALQEHIANGDLPWVRAGVQLYKKADGGAREMLSMSFGEALKAIPKYFLGLASHNILDTADFCVGPDVDDNRYLSYELAAKELQRRKVAVERIANTHLTPYKEKCLHQLSDEEGPLANAYGVKR